MRSVQLTDDFFHGAVSLEWKEDGVKPWRLPYKDYELFPPDGIGKKAEICAGVRLRLRTDSDIVILVFTPLEEDARMDCLVNGDHVLMAEVGQGKTEATFAMLPEGLSELEIFLPQNIGMTLTEILLSSGSSAEPWPDTRPRWITYGSSITQCVGATSPSRTWPAIVARKLGLNLTCLGYSGNCNLELMVARMIRDLPADIISLCVGINIYGSATLSPRVFKPALIGMLETIREKHAGTPLVVVSPIYATERETTKNSLGFTLPAMRLDVQETVELLQRRGDRNIRYLNGLHLFGPEDSVYLSDGLHPNSKGYKRIGERFAGLIF